VEVERILDRVVNVQVRAVQSIFTSLAHVFLDTHEGALDYLRCRVP
jgi:hypothetical protein